MVRITSVVRLVAYAFVVFLAGSTSLAAEETALDRYIATDDGEYHWKLVATHEEDTHWLHVLELTSQRWRSSDEVDRPVWTHWLTIVRPKNAAGDTAFLYIGGGSNKDSAPTSASERTTQLAVATGTVVAELGMVPNQPLYFTDTPDKGRYEDDLIAYSRMRYITTGEETWLVRLPMVKSGVKALDAVQEFLATKEGGELSVDKFVVAGGSKRGWTTWLVGVVDPRVVAIIPIVIDALNTEAITNHHLAAYGFFSPALDDYVRHGLYPDKVGTPEYRQMMRIEDPYYYRNRERMKIPKYVINSAGDQFFLPDNSNFYFAELPEPKYLRYVPNTKHSLAGSDVRASIQAFYESVLHNRPRPEFSWSSPNAGRIEVRTKSAPRQVNLWYATNPEARDFRLDTIGKAYQSRPIEPASPNLYVAEMSPPKTGFTAFFVELVYDSGGNEPFKFTTDVNVVPDVLPFADKLKDNGP